MALALSRLSYWVFGGKDNEPATSPMTSSSDFPPGFREPESLKFPSLNGGRVRSSAGRVKRKWGSREERGKRGVDREYDVVLVPSDGGCLSGDDSDYDSDWSVGWLEPHGPDFDSDGESSFAVLVPCYGRGRAEKGVKNGGVLGAGAGDRKKLFPSDGNDFIEQWLSSLHNM